MLCAALAVNKVRCEYRSQLLYIFSMRDVLQAMSRIVNDGQKQASVKPQAITKIGVDEMIN